MDNLCLVGLGLFGLLYLTSKKEKKIKEIEENVFIDFNGDKVLITKQFMLNKYFNKTDLEWKIPTDEVHNYPLHPFAGFDYMKLIPNSPPIFGRYIKLSENLIDLLVKLEPSVEIGDTVNINNEKYTLVVCGHDYPTISAITLNFAENINSEELSICKMKNIYKAMKNNYKCKKIIEPPIEWYNQSLWDDNTYLYKDLCGDGDTSTLETNDILDSNKLDDSETSDFEVDDDSDDTSEEQTDLDNFIDSNTSIDQFEENSDITSNDNQTELDNFVDSNTSINESNQNSDITSNDNQNELDNFIDSITSVDESLKKSEKSKSSEINLSDTSENNASMDVISATSYDDNSEMFNSKKIKCLKKNKPNKKKKSTKKKSDKKKSDKKKPTKKKSDKKKPTKKKSDKKKSDKKKPDKKKSNKKMSGGKKSNKKNKSQNKKKSNKKMSGVKKSNKKKKSQNKKKSNKIKINHSELQGGSSSLTNISKSILGRR